jgi:hypothetical protein
MVRKASARISGFASFKSWVVSCALSHRNLYVPPAESAVLSEQSLALCVHNSAGTESTWHTVSNMADNVDWYAHLLDLQAGNLHAVQDVWEEGDHVIVAHGHIGNDLLESILLGGVVLVFLSTSRQFLAELRHFALVKSLVNLPIQVVCVDDCKRRR